MSDAVSRNGSGACVYAQATSHALTGKDTQAVACYASSCSLPASSQSEKTHFIQINRKTGNRLRQQMVDEKTGAWFEGDNKARGYELKRGSYVEIEPEKPQAVEARAREPSTPTSFVPEEEIESGTTSALITLSLTTRAVRKLSR